MMPVTELISISSCLKCDKVFSLVDQLKESMQEFEMFTMEMELDSKPEKSKSQQVLSNLWQLISTIQSFKGDEKVEVGKDLGGNQILRRLAVSVEEPEAQSLEKENARPKSKSNPKSNAVANISKMMSIQQFQPNFKSNPNPDLSAAAKRSTELKRAKTLLRTIKCETPQGFYNLFECLKCERQFSFYFSGLKHVQNIHMNLGAKCPTCFIIFFSPKSLEIHIPKCHKREQLKLKQIKVWLKNDRKKPGKVYLQPQNKEKEQQKQNQKQKQAPSTRKRNQNRNSSKQFRNRREKQDKTFDPLKIKVRNPLPNFDLKKTLNVKVKIERVQMKDHENIQNVQFI